MYTKSDDNMTINTSNSDTVEITNNKGTTVDTGINLDSLPYVIIIAVVALALIAVVSKKRSAQNF